VHIVKKQMKIIFIINNLEWSENDEVQRRFRFRYFRMFFS
jgi:hypothetical protein